MKLRFEFSGALVYFQVAIDHLWYFRQQALSGDYCEFAFLNLRFSSILDFAPEHCLALRSKYGTWGHLEYTRQPPELAPKYRAVQVI